MHIIVDFVKNLQLSQTLPSVLNLRSVESIFLDDSFPLETRSVLDVIANPNTVSTFTNDILSFYVGISENLSAVSVCIFISFVFAKMYSKNNSTILLSKIISGGECLILVNGLYLTAYYLIRIYLMSLPDYYKTKYWLSPKLYDFFVNDQQTFYIFMLGLFILAVFTTIHLFVNSMRTAELTPETPVLTSLVACFSWGLLEATDFSLFIICLEGFSLTLYILATTGRTYGGISAAVKYFVFGTLGSILLYLGALGMFEISATMDMNGFNEISENYVNNVQSQAASYSNLTLAQSCILLGFLIKLGAAPLHQWVVDTYSGVPLFATAFYSTFVKLVLLILFLQFAVTFNSVKEIEYAALLSLIVGCFGALRQIEIKRFLAYSSITHTGYLLMGDLTATYVYLITYVFASILFFSVILSVSVNSKEFVYLSDLRFIGQSGSQLNRVALVVALASMAGIPPFAGFYGKMSVWMSLIEDIFLFNDVWSYGLFFFNILTSLISMFYYAQVMCILFVNNENEIKAAVTQNNINHKNVVAIQYAGVIVITLWTFIMPSIFTILQEIL